MLGIIALTKQGKVLADTLHELYAEPSVILDRGDRSLGQEIEKWFIKYDKLVFIMATGIVVRLIAPYLKHKSVDPAIVVMDEAAQFAISLLSGHLGGANQLSTDIAGCVKGCIPIITTASDVSGYISIDMLVNKADYRLIDYDMAKQLTAALVNGKNLGLVDDTQLFADDWYSRGYIKYDRLEVAVEAYKNHDIEGIVWLSNKVKTVEVPMVQLYPKNLMLGIGCKGGISEEIITAQVQSYILQQGYSMKSLSLIGTAWVKLDEEGLLAFANKYKLGFTTYSKSDISEVEHLFEGSDFVKRTIGVSCVSMPCGYLASHKGTSVGKLLKEKGVTLSLWQEA